MAFWSKTANDANFHTDLLGFDRRDADNLKMWERQAPEPRALRMIAILTAQIANRREFAAPCRLFSTEVENKK